MYWPREEMVAMNNRALARMAAVHPEHKAAAELRARVGKCRQFRKHPPHQTGFQEAKRMRCYYRLLRALQEMMGHSVYQPLGQSILAEVARTRCVSVAAIREYSRARKIIPIRQEAAYRLYTETALSLPQIGGILGRDHTTVIYSIEKHAKRNNLPYPERP